jgi:glycosyltransferase involved in cell wall biosynthesis
VLRGAAAAGGVPVYGLVESARRKSDIVHVHDGRSAVIGLVHATLGRTALLRTQHFVRPASQERQGWSRAASMMAHRRINGRLDGYICVSVAAATAAQQRRDAGRAPLRVIPPGARLASDEQVGEAILDRAQAAQPGVATAGRLESERRMDVLIDAIPIVRRAFPGCRFLIAGAGNAEHELKSRARALALEGVIDWTGWLPDTAPVLAGSHVYVNTWPSEGFGMATAEAMGYSLPVVVTDTGASPELVEDSRTGTVVEALSPAALASAICDLLQDRRRATEMGAAARERAVRLYSFGSTAQSTLEFYEQLPRLNRGR